MKATTIHALLLSLVVMAGVAATDAYAQSNTERLQDIHEDSSIIKGIVEAIQSALTTLGEQIDGLVESMTSVETSVNDMSSKISGFETTIDTRLTGVEMRLSEISSEVSGLSVVSNGTGDSTLTTVALNDLINGISRINDRLSGIERDVDFLQAQVASVADQVSAPAPTPTPITPQRGSLVESTIQKDVTAYNYKQSGQKKSDRNSYNYYDLDLTFSCNNDVFIDNVKMIQRLAEDGSEQYLKLNAVHAGTGASETEPNGINYVQVEGRNLYHNWFLVSGDDHIEYNPSSQDFDNMALRSNQALSFETRVYDGNFTTAGVYNTATLTVNDTLMIADAPKPERIDRVLTDSSIELYTLEVTYRTYFLNTSCSLNFGKGSSSGFNVDTVSTLNFGANVEESTSILKKFDNTIDCSGNPVEITSLTTGISEDWNDSISSFAKLYLTVEDGVDDDQPDATFEFDSDGTATLSDGDYPSFSNADLKVHGTLPGDGLLISLEYLSVSANVCEDTESTS